VLAAGPPDQPGPVEQGQLDQQLGTDVPGVRGRTALSQRIGHADVAFTMKQYVQTDLEADRQVANTLAELIIGGALASLDQTGAT
jgi:hypothetical protein